MSRSQSRAVKPGIERAMRALSWARLCPDGAVAPDAQRATTDLSRPSSEATRARLIDNTLRTRVNFSEKGSVMLSRLRSCR